MNGRSLRLWVLGIPLLSGGTALGQATLTVPGDYPTIQLAINAAAPGDTVLVGPGIYIGAIDFVGKGITVQSAAGPASTVLQVNLSPARIVRFVSAEPPTAVLRGFTIRGSTAGGVLVNNGAAPLIVGNRIEENPGCSGAGIQVQAASPRIVGNVIANNGLFACGGGEGGGILLYQDCSGAEIVDNAIVGNYAGSGAGLAITAAGTPLIRGNTIAGNVASGFSGGIGYSNSSPRIVQNFFFGNTAASPSGGGGAIGVSSPNANPVAQIVNNTVVGNSASSGSALYTTGLDYPVRIENNLFVGPAGMSVVHAPVYTAVATFRNNDVFRPGGGPYGGGMPNLTGTNGNLSVDPLFVDAPLGDFHLVAGSPCVDAGFTAILNPPLTDADGDARIFDGNGDGSAAIDLGQDERSPATRFGSGCPVSPGLVPRIGLTGASPAIGGSIGVLLSNTPPASLAVFVLSLAPAVPPLPLAGVGLGACSLAVEPGVLVPATTGGSGFGGGSVATSFPVPNDSALHGIHVFFQGYAAAGPGIVLPGGMSVGLDVVLP